MFSRVTSSTTTPRKLSGAKKVEAKATGAGASTMVGAAGGAGGAVCCADAHDGDASAQRAAKVSIAFLFMDTREPPEREFSILLHAPAPGPVPKFSPPRRVSAPRPAARPLRR